MVPGKFGKKMEKNKLVKKYWSSKCCKKNYNKKKFGQKKVGRKFRLGKDRVQKIVGLR